MLNTSSMQPIDYRIATWTDLQGRICGERELILKAWRAIAHPATTREAAAPAGIDILSFRPRTTELFQLGFLELCGGHKHKHEGLYLARSDAEVAEDFNCRRLHAANAQQLELEIKS